jgi:transcriptional regulator with XRE-family HTH domain
MTKVSAEELYRLYHEENLSQRQIGERLGVTQSSVSNWMSEHDIKSDIASSWTEKEKRVLKQNYPGDKSEISELLPERSWNAIKLKAMDLGLARNQEEYRNSEELAEKCRKLAEENEIDVKFDETESLSYILGVIDGDGFHDNNGTIGLEVKDSEFAEKFVENLKALGLNPNTGQREGKEAVWASSQVVVAWLQNLQNKVDWLSDEGDAWKYIEGQYDSDGNLHPCGSPRICSYDEQEKKIVQKILQNLNVECNIQQNNVWVAKSSSNKFFNNVNSVLDRRNK